jgi:glutamine synthetase
VVVKIAFVELVFTGMNGIPRGKRLRRHELPAVYKVGRKPRFFEYSAI